MLQRRRKLSKHVLFLQDKIPTYKSHLALQTIRDLGFELLEQPPYPAHLASSNYHVFSQLEKKSLRSRTFSFNEEVTDAVDAWFSEQDKIFL